MSSAVAQLGYQIKLDQYEGPLALLLHLIRKEEMDIYDIPIHKITFQYLEYIKKMQQLDLEFAGEFVAMAATLIHIKSRMLLPTYDESGEVIETEDPRKELVQKLLEYQKYQEAAQKLYGRPLLGRDFWPKGLRETIEPEGEGEIIISEDNALFALIGTYRKVVRAMKKGVHKVGAKGQSIAHRILELRDRLIPGRKTTLRELIQQTESYQEKLLITFLSLLELGKMGFISLFQSEPYAEIHVDVRKEVDRDVVSKVEEYDSKNADRVAERLTAVQQDTEQEENSEETSENTAQMTFGSEELDEGEILASDEEIAAEEALLETSPGPDFNGTPETMI